MNEMLLLATLSTYYSQLEKRLEGAIDQRVPEVRKLIAEAAWDVLIGSCPPSAATELAPRRADTIAALLEQRNQFADVVHSIGRKLPRFPFQGPVNLGLALNRRINMVLLAQNGPVHDYALMIRNAVHGNVPVLDIATTTWDDLKDRNAIFYGTPTGNKFIGEIFAAANWEVTPTHISIGGRKFEGENLVFITCRARPDDPTLADIIYSGANEDAVVGINVLHHGPSDFVIGRRTKPNKYQILTRGNFAKGPKGEPTTKLNA